ncbi:sigma-54-dependent transcriptional regulator [Brevibacillus ginsengisoli]|uniref:sigma-54-dependent transcriptional regulator n=1 Tax=Brevibacillus ginsengisoli TaxID=363854 RepID=UPI003CEB9126
MNYNQHILVVDDEPEYRKLLSSRLTRKGYTVYEAGDGLEALEYIKQSSVQLVLLDLKMPRMDGMTFLQICKETHPFIQVIVLTAHGTIETAIEAIKMGAYDYLTKPYQLKDLDSLILKALDQQHTEEEGQQSKQESCAEGTFVAESPVMKALVSTAERIAQTSYSVLLTGESGTGKEVFAHYIWEKSLRHDKPFIPINMGAIPESVLESELFGHEKGAFTGAIQQKQGLVEMADKGTLFLDEVGDMPYPLQVKLLRFLESGEYRRVGGNTLKRVDTRIIAATNMNLEQKVEDGSFRSDLYYRLKVVDLEIPPLRQRREDILPLANFFLHRLHRNHISKNLTKEAAEALMQYHYPGNVRELAHIVERGAVLSLGQHISPSDLFPNHSFTNVEEVNPPAHSAIEGEEQIEPLKDLEKLHITRALQITDWNKTKAAEKLGISVRNLYRKIEEYAIKP